MKEIDRIKEMDAQQLADWICREVMKNECEECPLSKACNWNSSVIIKKLEKELPTEITKTVFCVPCKKVLDPNCKGNGKESCLHYEHRDVQSY